MGIEYNSYTGTFSGGLTSTPDHSREDGERAHWPTPHKTAPQTRVEVGRGGTEVTFRSGQMTLAKDSDQTNTFEAATGFAREGDLLSTAWSKTGSPVVGRALCASDTVEFQGQRGTLAVFERMGLVARDAAGNYFATTEGNSGASMPEGRKAATQLADGGTAEGAEMTGFRADDATEATMTELVETVAPSTQMAIISAYIADGEISSNIISRAASQAGVSPEEMTAKLDAAMVGMEHAVAERLAPLGVHDAELFGEWLWGTTDRQGRAHEAIFALMTGNSTTGIDQLAGEFAESLDQFDQEAVTYALDEAGIAHRKDGGRVIIILPDGTQLSYGVAVKQGLIKVSRA